MDKKLKSDFRHDKLEIPVEANSSLGSFESGDGAIKRDVEDDDFINLSLSNKTTALSSPELIKKTDKFLASLKAITNSYPVKVQTDQLGFSLFFHKRNPESFSEMKEYDAENAAWFYRSLQKEGVIFNASQNDLNHVGEAHSDKQLRLVIIAVQRALSYVYGYVDNM
jgi:glutamate-1-semialdehyde aminotransferase